MRLETTAKKKNLRDNLHCLHDLQYHRAFHECKLLILLSKHKEDTGIIWGDILEKYVMYGSQLSRGLKWSRSEALVAYCVHLS